MPGGLQSAKGRKIAQSVLGTIASKQKSYANEYSRPPRSTNINPDNIKADDTGVGDFVRGGVNGTF